MKQFRFSDWRIYTEAQNVFLDKLSLVHNLPKEYRYDLGSQIVRSSFSVILNIAEGSGKSSDAELNRYLDISIGSAYETKAALDALFLAKLCDEKQKSELAEKLRALVSQIGGFKRQLKPKKLLP